MPQTAIGFGVVLSAVGAAFYAGTGAVSVTALIPALVGVLLVLAGFAAQRWPAARRHAMHAAALVGTLGAVGSAPGLVKLPALLAGHAVARPAAVVERAITALLCLVFVGLCVRSFVVARRERRI